VALSASVVGVVPSIASAAVAVNTIALSGTTGTAVDFGPGGGLSYSPDLATIGPAGQVAFMATLSGSGISSSNNDALYTSVGGVRTKVAGEGVDGPGPATSPYFSTFASPTWDANGNLQFSGTTAGAGGGVFTQAYVATLNGGTPAYATRAGGSPGPNVGAGIDYQIMNSPVFNGGKTAVQAGLNGSGVTGSNDGVLLSNIGGTFGPIAREGFTGLLGPGIASETNAVFYSVSGVASNPVLNINGKVAFIASILSSSITGAIMTNTNGAGNVMIARTNTDTALGPNLGTGVRYSAFLTNSSITSLSINSAGTVAYGALLTGTGVVSNTNDRGIFTNNGASSTPIARTGDATYGPNLGAGTNFTAFNFPVINAAGAVAFVGTVGGGSIPAGTTGIFTNASGTVQAVARRGVEAFPGTGVTFDSFFNPTLNASGNVAFFAGLAGSGVNSTNNSALFATFEGAVIPVVRLGDAFDVDPSALVDNRTVTAIAFISNTFTGLSGNGDGRVSGFNDAGVVAFTLTFSDGSKGVFTATVPEPTTLAGLTSLTLLTLRRRAGRN
jgi:hypothetical protein